MPTPNAAELKAIRPRHGLHEPNPPTCLCGDPWPCDTIRLCVLVAQQQQQIDALKQDVTESASLSEAVCSALTRVLQADGVIARAEAERDARDLLKGTIR